MHEYVSAARFLAEDGMRTLPIACRLVPLDQWLVTHVDTSWKVKDIKQWILSKCNVWGTASAPQPPRFRPASPVTFSAPSRRSSLDSGSWPETEEGGEDDDWDAFAALDYNAEIRASDPGPAFENTRSPLIGSISEHAVSTSSFYVPSPPAQRGNLDSEFAVTSAQYTLVSFSNGFILDDDADLSWYKPRPFEMLEVHRAGAIVSLPRNGIAYAEPFFEYPVRVCERPHGKRAVRTSDDQQAHAIEWKPRWAIIRDGVLHLCKETHTPPTHRFPIAALCSLCTPGQAGLTCSGRSTSGHVICAKFDRMSSGTVVGGESEDAITPAVQRKKKPKTSSWVILDMPNRSSYENLLRVLHRLAPYPIRSSFVPPRTPMTSPTSISSPRKMSVSSGTVPSPSTSEPLFTSSASAFFGVQYPEWRMALLQRSRTAGRGAVGPALALAQANCIFANNRFCEPLHQPLPRAPSISEGLRRRADQVSSLVGSEDEDASRELETASPLPWQTALSEEEDDEDDDDDVESEVEWEGWVRDLSRRATRPPPLSPFPVASNTLTERAGALSPSSPSSSEADHDLTESSGTARVRTFSYSPNPLRPNSPHRSRSNTVSAAGTAFGSTYTYTSTTTTTITTYVDRVPDVRTPPSSSAPGTWTHHAYTGPIASPPSPPVSSPRNTPRARRVQAPSGSPVIGAPARLTPPQSLSAAGSRAASVSGSEMSSSVGDMSGGNGRNGGIGGVKRIVRGVSIRNAFSTERFVRGLEDALDFVDGR